MPEGIPVMKQGERVELPELPPVLPLMDQSAPLSVSSLFRKYPQYSASDDCPAFHSVIE